MKRVTYLLRDTEGRVQARMTLAENEVVSLEPWMIHNVHQRGWSLEAYERTDSGVQIHGWANWESVADSLASVIAIWLADGEMDEEGAEQLAATAQKALDDYHVAQMEVRVAEADAQPKKEDETDA